MGGALRDALLGEPHTDYDFATSATPTQVTALFRRTAPVGEKYGTVGVLDRRRVLHEVTTFRRDVTTDGRHAVVAYGVSLDDDLARRDFTINAIAYHPLRHEWRDPFGGAARPRAPASCAPSATPAQRFREDYLRILRGLRFAARFGFAIEPDTWAAAVAAAPGLAQLSAERVRDEWFKSLRTARSVPALVRLWLEAGAAEHWMPELRPVAPSRLAAAGAVGAERARPGAADGAAPGRRDRRRCSDGSGPRTRRSSASRRSRAAPAAPAGDDPAAVRRWLAAVGPRGGRPAPAARASARAAPAPWAVEVSAIRERGDPLDARRPGGHRERPAGARCRPGRGSARCWRRCSTGCSTIPRSTARDACSPWPGSCRESARLRGRRGVRQRGGRARRGAARAPQPAGDRRLPRVRRRVHARGGAAGRDARGAARLAVGGAVTSSPDTWRCIWPSTCSRRTSTSARRPTG